MDRVKRYALIADVHSNIEALEAVLEHIQALRPAVEDIWCLGDVIDYGADPLACVQLLREHVAPENWIAGDHEWALTDKKDMARLFQPRPLQALQWTRQRLPPTEQDWLAGLNIRRELSWCTVVHSWPVPGKEAGLPSDPRAVEASETYLDNPTKVQGQAENFSTPVCFYGHTHLSDNYTYQINRQGRLRARSDIDYLAQSSTARRRPSPVALTFARTYSYDLKSQRLMINVGSVGQPRQEIQGCHATYCLVRYNPSTGMLYVQHQLVPYNWRSTYRKIIEAGLPLDYARMVANRCAVDI